MLTHPLIAIAITSIAGLVLNMRVLRGREAPWRLSILHGILGVIGLVLVLATANTAAVVQNDLEATVNTASVALSFCVAVGIALGYFHFKQHTPPRIAVYAHAGSAVAGLVWLAFAWFNM